MWLGKIDKAFAKSRDEFALHFKRKYAGEAPPIWIACETWDFGAVSVLYGGLRKVDQAAIAQEYGIPSFSVMESWIRALNVVRNTCAHHGRFWNKPLVAQPVWPTGIVELAHVIADIKAQTRIYAVACIAEYMLGTINPSSSWGGRLKALCATFPKHPSLSLASAGFPAGWETQALWN